MDKMLAEWKKRPYGAKQQAAPAAPPQPQYPPQPGPGPAQYQGGYDGQYPPQYGAYQGGEFELCCGWAGLDWQPSCGRGRGVPLSAWRGPGAAACIGSGLGAFP